MPKSSFLLFKRSNGYWYILHTKEDGRTRWKSTKCRVKSDALKALTEFKRLMEQKPSQKLLSSFIDDFLTVARGVYSPGTVTLYRLTLSKFLDLMGDLMLSEITPRHLDLFTTERLKKVKAVTVHREMRTLRAAFNRAMKWKLLQSSPCDLKHLPRTAESPPSYFSKEDFQKLLDVIEESWLREILLFAVLTGMRAEEK